MTELDLEIPGLATEIITEYGKDISYISFADADQNNNYNINTGSVGGGESAAIIIKGIVEPYTGQRMIAGLVEAEDLKVTVAAESFNSKPTTSDQLGIDGQNFTIVNVLPIYSGELIAIYEFQVRRG